MTQTVTSTSTIDGRPGPALSAAALARQYSLVLFQILGTT